MILRTKIRSYNEMDFHSPDRFSFGKSEVTVGSGMSNGNSGAYNLITPAGKVLPRINGHSNVSLESQSVHST